MISISNSMVVQSFTDSMIHQLSTATWDLDPGNDMGPTVTPMSLWVMWIIIHIESNCHCQLQQCDQPATTNTTNTFFVSDNRWVAHRISGLLHYCWVEAHDCLWQDSHRKFCGHGWGHWRERRQPVNLIISVQCRALNKMSVVQFCLLCVGLWHEKRQCFFWVIQSYHTIQSLSHTQSYFFSKTVKQTRNKYMTSSDKGSGSSCILSFMLTWYRAVQACGFDTCPPRQNN